MVKETQEGCLSRSISLFLRTIQFVKTEAACRKDFFDKLAPPGTRTRGRLIPAMPGRLFFVNYLHQPIVVIGGKHYNNNINYIISLMETGVSFSTIDQLVLPEAWMDSHRSKNKKEAHSL